MTSRFSYLIRSSLALVGLLLTATGLVATFTEQIGSSNGIRVFDSVVCLAVGVPLFLSSAFSPQPISKGTLKGYVAGCIVSTTLLLLGNVIAAALGKNVETGFWIACAVSLGGQVFSEGKSLLSGRSGSSSHANGGGAQGLLSGSEERSG